MSKKETIDKNGNTWEWEETPETIEALKRLEESVKAANEYRNRN